MVAFKSSLDSAVVYKFCIAKPFDRVMGIELLVGRQGEILLVFL